MKYFILAMVISSIPFTTTAFAENPYKDHRAREIKSLSPEQIDGYLHGEGMGYAKAAELNNYPGPKHVLDLAKELNLSQEQIDKTQAIYKAMQTQAAMLGRKLIDKEKVLNLKFAGNTIDKGSLSILISEIGALQAKIRLTHLYAHLETKNLLSGDEIDMYNKLRGYETKDHQHQHY